MWSCRLVSLAKAIDVHTAVVRLSFVMDFANAAKADGGFKEMMQRISPDAKRISPDAKRTSLVSILLINAKTVASTTSSAIQQIKLIVGLLLA